MVSVLETLYGILCACAGGVIINGGSIGDAIDKTFLGVSDTIELFFDIIAINSALVDKAVVDAGVDISGAATKSVTGAFVDETAVLKDGGAIDGHFDNGFSVSVEVIFSCPVLDSSATVDSL
ncbi:hypothetical protein NDU88_006479 [Pleurodeles waltl]|uniref:Uncharacterized protein n=1 Tax=Pleurodeles waltl TaxID=8319 RepID=A0AAV7TYM0_PLEWA|nr:hypothetical protein NDU88_006479 [Pleurodeles waltl]